MFSNVIEYLVNEYRKFENKNENENKVQNIRIEVWKCKTT